MAGFDNEVMYANNVDFTGGATPSAKVTTDGQLLIGATASPNIRVGTLSGGNNITVTAGAGTLSAAVTGTTNHAVQVGNASGSLTSVATGNANQILQSGGAGADPAWSTATYPATAGTNLTLLQSNGTNFVNTSATYPASTTANQILYSSATNVVGQITAAANSVLLTNGSSVPSLGTSLTNNFTYTSSTAGSNRFIKIEHTDNTNTASNSIIFSESGGASGGDALLRVGVASVRYYCWGVDTSDSQKLKVNTGTAGTLTPSTGTNIMTVTSGGARTLPLNPAVFAYVHNGGANIANVTGDATTYTVIFDTEALDSGSNFDTGTGIFTAPVAGNYLVCANVTLTNLGVAHTSAQLYIDNNTALTKNIVNPIANAVSGEYTLSLSNIYPIAASGTIKIQIIVSGSTKTVGVKYDNFGYYSNVSINLLG